MLAPEKEEKGREVSGGLLAVGFSAIIQGAAEGWLEEAVRREGLKKVKWSGEKQSCSFCLRLRSVAVTTGRDDGLEELDELDELKEADE